MVFDYSVHSLLDRFIQRNNYNDEDVVKYIRYSGFYELKEIGSGGYSTIYTAKYDYAAEENMEEIVVLKRFKSFDETPELFISEVSNNNWYIN